jgi:hypothetical protein
MITQGNSWTRMHALAQRARLAGARRQRLDVRLSPEESALLADVLEAALQFMSAVTGRPELDDTTPSSAELSYLAMEGGGFSWLAEEPELYSDGDLQERFAWTATSNAGR